MRICFLNLQSIGECLFCAHVDSLRACAIIAALRGLIPRVFLTAFFLASYVV